MSTILLLYFAMILHISNIPATAGLPEPLKYGKLYASDPVQLFSTFFDCTRKKNSKNSRKNSWFEVRVLNHWISIDFLEILLGISRTCFFELFNEFFFSRGIRGIPYFVVPDLAVGHGSVDPGSDW